MRRALFAAGVALILSVVSHPRPALGQIIFQPIVQQFPSGVGLNVTPVVSADRRYVRMTIGAQFSTIQGFDTYNFPGGAVSNGGGMGGAGGGLGGAGGGFRSVVVDAGMDGVAGPSLPMAMPMQDWDFYPSQGSAQASAMLNGMTGPRQPFLLNPNPAPVDGPRVRPKRSARPKQPALPRPR